MANFASKRNKRQIGMSKIFVICMATLMLAACAANGGRKAVSDALAEDRGKKILHVFTGVEREWKL